LIQINVSRGYFAGVNVLNSSPLQECNQKCRKFLRKNIWLKSPKVAVMNTEHFAPNSALVRVRNYRQISFTRHRGCGLRQCSDGQLKVLSIKQSTLSRSIQLLEHRVGAATFE